MNNLAEQYNNPQMGQPQFQGGALAQASASREMEEVKGQIFMAKQFPRNVFQAEQRVLDTCRRPALAQVAMYQYPRGGQRVTGPSIRLAEAIAQNWGNLSYGIQELEQRDGESVAKAFCWDLETNVRQEKVFTVKHSMKAKGTIKKLEDPRDIYEKVANDGARRLRSCILGVIPGDIIDKAIIQCNETLAGNSQGPLKDRIANALRSYKENHRVTQEMIEAKFGYNADSFTEYDYVELINIFNSLRDGLSKVEDWFNKEDAKNQSSGLGDDFKAQAEPKAEVKSDAPKDIPIE
ncbi:hypothetical protein ACQKNX_04775 [Lysinibacillus sp. NPDC093712]|uniref:hypothetical protein n=1 Tax=Lysinibacillus sp. NPDC093712 TaxID=3390579 RepID=UPI003D003DAD